MKPVGRDSRRAPIPSFGGPGSTEFRPTVYDPTARPKSSAYRGCKLNRDLSVNLKLQQFRVPHSALRN